MYEEIEEINNTLAVFPQFVNDSLYSDTAIFPYVADIGDHTMTFYSYDVGSSYITILLKQQSNPTIGTGHAIVFDLSQNIKYVISNAVQPTALTTALSYYVKTTALTTTLLDYVKTTALSSYVKITVLTIILLYYVRTTALSPYGKKTY